MLAIILLAAFAVIFCLFYFLVAWLIKTSDIDKPAVYYTSRTIAHYKGDYEQIKALIARANTHGQIKDLFSAVYSFRLRYRHFKRYNVDVEKTTDTLIELLDQRLTALNLNTPKNKLLTFFF